MARFRGRSSRLFCVQRGETGIDAIDSGGLRLSPDMPSIKPDYGMGPYQALMAAAVSLARQDRDDPKYSEEARAFLRSPLVESFAESLGYGGSFE